MTTAARTSGFPMGWAFVALFLAAVVLAPFAAMPVMMTGSTEPTVVKIPADMDDAELRTEIDAAEVEVVVAWEEVKLKWGAASQAAYEAALGASLDADARHTAASEEAMARGWYKCVYTGVELAEIATTKMIVLDLEDGPCEVAVGHIGKNHGTEAVHAVQTGGFKKGNCGDSEKSYAYKLADDGRYWLRIMWNGKVVTCYKVTWSLLLYYFKQDGCEPPRPPFSHDGMSAPAY